MSAVLEERREKDRLRARAYRERIGRDEINARNRARRAANPDSVRAYHAAWREANRKKVVSYTRRWQKVNPERTQEAYRAWASANPEKRAAINRKWRLAHPEAIAAHDARRRAQKRALTFGVTPDQVKARWAMWGGRCWICGSPATCTDHVKPLAAGGAHLASNLRPACQSCNASKRATWPFRVAA